MLSAGEVGHSLAFLSLAYIAITFIFRVGSLSTGEHVSAAHRKKSLILSLGVILLGIALKLVI